MGTVHADAVRKLVNERMADPEYAATVYLYLRKLQAGEFDQEYVDIFFQKFRGDIDVYDAHCFAELHSLRCSGRLAMCGVNVGAEPGSDKNVEHNNSVMHCEDEPGRMFFGKFYGGHGDSDGHYGWKSPLVMDTFTEDAAGDLVKSSVVIPPRRVELEVGYTEASRTLLHVLCPWTGGAVARWPYGQTSVKILVML